MTTTPKHELGSGNIFADIGLPDADAHLMKAQLVSRIQDILDERGLSQTAASALMGIRQPDLSRILRGQFRGFSVARLMTMLTGLGFEVAITLKPEGAGVSPEMAVRLATAFGGSAQTWINLQANYDYAQVRKREAALKATVKPVKPTGNMVPA